MASVARHKIWAAFAAVFTLLAMPAFAQIEVAPSEYAACLTPAGETRNNLRYPEDVLRAGVAGATTVEMEFTAPDSPPSVKVTNGSEPRLNDAVVQHVRQYRVPCLVAGRSARFTQQFVFIPNAEGKISWTDIKDAEASEAACVTHLHPGTQPMWPDVGFGSSTIRRVTVQGVVLARIRFVSKDGPPKVEIAPTTLHEAFVRSVQEWASDYRLPCYDGNPVEATQWFRFKLEDFPQSPLLRDTTLAGFLSAVKIDNQRRYFELDRMSCPFQIRLQYRQPLMANRVGEIGEHVASRQPLLDWLASLRFNTKPAIENLLLTESMTISVPCGKIDL